MKENIKIDIKYHFTKDVKDGQDVDTYSNTLKEYHRILWSKPLPIDNNINFNLQIGIKDCYLYHKSELGEFILGSDSITTSCWGYLQKEQARESLKTIKNTLKNYEEETIELRDLGYTIGAYIIFPNRKINNHQTINQARGANPKIGDRFDLTLECIRRFYKNPKEETPLRDVFNRYKNFFDLFVDFKGYTDFFLLQDLLDTNDNIKFYSKFDNFQTNPTFNTIEEYREYKEKVLNFINDRNKRIESFNKN